MIRIAPTDPDSPAARALIAASDAYMAALYPAESNHLDPPGVLKAANVLFLGCFIGTELVGCGAVKLLEDDGRYGEIKRVFVTGPHRGKGYSRAIMRELEQHLIRQGIGTARLETGIHQPEALGLYRRLGYIERAPFGSYAPDPLSLFMEKRLQTRLPAYRDRIVPAALGCPTPAGPFDSTYAFQLPDGDWVELPLVALPPDQSTAIVSLCITENSFELEDRLSTAMASQARELGAEVIVGMPTLGMVLAASVARKLAHPHYVPLSYSRKFWFDDALSVPVRSITSPAAGKRVYLDPRIVDRLARGRVVLVDDVVSTGASLLAQLALMRLAGVTVSGVVTAMQESRLWIEALRSAAPELLPRMRTVLRSPLFRRMDGGWMPDADTLPLAQETH